MLLNVKLLGSASNSISIEADSDESVESLKQKLEKKLKLEPNSEQMLMFMGKPLQNGTNLSNYKLPPGAKLHLLIKEASTSSSSSSSSARTTASSSSTLEEILFQNLRKYFKSDEDTKKVIRLFQRDLQNKFAAMNLDDIERFAKHYNKNPEDIQF